ncbi:glycosyltransferase family 2 protein [Promicromonospora sp. MEB111]|uniref:glycosyltransferase family 2 protein n=1 Tax=Promicromonospora sp. MEB111 TaxID=3040301 RepID=UPI00254BEBB0|nr:glycosyltransferase family 2 protein [Promicromonospora sp. MEB111]
MSAGGAGRLDHAAAAWRARVDRDATGGPGLGARAVRTLASWVPSPLAPRSYRRRPPSAPQLRPRVSVVVPCYDYGRFLPQTVGSLVTQEGVDVEVILVDDASTDDSLAVARALAAEHPGVTVLANERNLGQVESFNRGWEHSTGEFVVRLDADDMLPPGALARATALLEQHPEVGLVYGHPQHFDDGTPPVPALGELSWTVWDGRAWLAERCRTGVSCITSPEVVMRADLLKDVGPLDPHLRFTMDVEMWLRFAAVADVGYVGGADQALHREHAGSLSVNEGSGALLDLRARADAYDRLFANVGDRLTGAHGLHDRARSALAQDALRYAAAAADRAEPPAPYLELAVEVWPGSREWPSAARIARRAARAERTGRAGYGAVVRRITRRARTELMYLRWATSGL